MNTGDNERPVSSGISEIFPAGNFQKSDMGTAEPSHIAPRQDESTRGGEQSVKARPSENEETSAQGASEEKQRSRRERRKRRSRRRGRDFGDTGDTAELAPGAADEADGPNDENDFADVPELPGVGGFDDEGHMIPPVQEYTEVVLTTEAPNTAEVVGVRFKNTGKTYYFAPGPLALKKGDCAIVETSRGLELGFISIPNTHIPVSAIVPPLRPVLREAGEEDRVKYEENLKKEKEAFSICLEKIRDHGLEMKLIDAEYTFDQSKLTFYFSADGRVDFRELVKDLAGVFRTRIELRQIGIRDEAKQVGGLGVCGQPFCCSTFLSDFAQVSIKMAKEQNLSLNSAKISGSCGRLMCCLRYENDTYIEEKKRTPAVGSSVKTSEGVGVVVESAPLRGKIKVRFGDEQNQTFHEFDRAEVTVLPRSSDKKAEQPQEQAPALSQEEPGERFDGE